jgi:hypothetical protein
MAGPDFYEQFQVCDVAHFGAVLHIFARVRAPSSGEISARFAVFAEKNQF